MINLADMSSAKRVRDPLLLFPLNFTTGSGSSFALMFADQYANTYEVRGGLTGRRLVSRQGFASKQRRAEREFRTGSIAVLSVALLGDGLASLFAADSWNEGIWSGERSTRPTMPLARTMRSLAFPGWGQLHGGETWKGAGFMILGAGLLGAQLSSENKATTAQRAYKAWADGSLIFPVVARVYGHSPDLVYTVVLANTSRWRGQVERSARSRDRLLTPLVAFWSINVVDAAFWSGKNRLAVAPLFQIGSDEGRGTLGRVGFSMRFDSEGPNRIGWKSQWLSRCDSSLAIQEGTL